MRRYRYKAIDTNGETLGGQVRAASRSEAVERLQKRGCSLLELQEVEGPSQSWWWRSISDKKLRNSFFVVLALVGMLIAYIVGGGESFQSQKSETVPKQSVVIRGRVSQPVESRERLTMVFHLPEVPLRIERSCSEMLADDGTYVFRYEFQSPREARTFLVELTENGNVVKSSGEVSLRDAAPDL
jgi:hypothetical protein